MTTEKNTMPDLFTLADTIATRYYSLEAKEEQRILWGAEGVALFDKARDNLYNALYEYSTAAFILEQLEKCTLPDGVMERAKEKAVDGLAIATVNLIKELPPDYETRMK